MNRVKRDDEVVAANTLAKSIADQAIGDKPMKKPNPMASKRGDAGASALTPEQKSKIARTGAEARWAKSGRN